MFGLVPPCYPAIPRRFSEAFSTKSALVLAMCLSVPSVAAAQAIPSAIHANPRNSWKKPPKSVEGLRDNTGERARTLCAVYRGFVKWRPDNTSQLSGQRAHGSNPEGHAGQDCDD